VPLPGGGTREVTLEEALQQQTFQKALKGDRKAQREVLKWIRKREAWLAKNASARSASSASCCGRLCGERTLDIIDEGYDIACLLRGTEMTRMG
jgi:hypothetical protein